jgi:hypothetical protein
VYVEIGGGHKVDGPSLDGRSATQQGIELGVVRCLGSSCLLRACFEVERKSSKMQTSQIFVSDSDRSPSWSIGGHGPQFVAGPLDGIVDGSAASAPDAVREGLLAAQGGFAGANESVRGVACAKEVSQRRHPHGPPTLAFDALQALPQVFFDTFTVSFLREGPVQYLQQDTAWLEASFRFFATAMKQL